MGEIRQMRISKTAGILAAAAVGVAMIAWVAPANAAKGGNGGGKPDDGGGSETQAIVPIVALFESTGHITITLPTGPLTPLSDDALSANNGHSHLSQNGNYTLQLGGGRRKNAKRSDRELTFDFTDVVFGDSPEDSLELRELFLPMNRKYCRQIDYSGPTPTCPEDQWFDSYADGSQPGYQAMEIGKPVPVSISLWPRTGPDYRMVCTESSNDQFGMAASLDTEFATAACVRVGSANTCEQWVIYGNDRNANGENMDCGLWLDGVKQGVFNMDFRLHLCLEDEFGNPDSACAAPFNQP
jgi:hypothetical protein